MFFFPLPPGAGRGVLPANVPLCARTAIPPRPFFRRGPPPRAETCAAVGEKRQHFRGKHAALFPKSGSAFSRKMQRFRPRGAGERTAGWGAGACAVRGYYVHLPPNQPARWGWAGSYLSVKRTFQAYLPLSNFATSRKNREETATGASALDVSSCAPGREPARHLCDIIWTWAGCALPILGKGNAKAG